MAYDVLKAGIANVVKQNGNNEITGNLLQQVLFSMINSLGVGYQYVGIATRATNPGTPDQNVFYLATTPDTYTNFGGLVVADGEVALLVWSGTAWSKQTPDIATRTEVSQLGQGVPVCIAENIGEIFDSADWTTVGNCYISDVGGWVSDANYESKSFSVELLRGLDIIVIANKIGNAIISFLTDINYPGTPSFASGETGRRVITTGTFSKITIPDNAIYAVVTTVNSGEDRTPEIYSTTKRIDKIEEKLNTNLQDLNAGIITGNKLYADKTFSKIINNNAVFESSSPSLYAKLLNVETLKGQSISVASNSNKNAIIAFLVSADITSTPRFCLTENNRHVVLAGNTETFTIPQDCKYLYVVQFNDNINAIPDIVVGSSYTKLNKEHDALLAKTENNIFDELDWFNNRIDDNKGCILNITDSNRIRSYFSAKAGSKLYYDIPAYYKIAFVVWNNNTLPIPSSTGWLKDKGYVNVPVDSIIIVNIANIRDLAIDYSEITPDFKLYITDRDSEYINSIIPQEFKYINYGHDDNLNPAFNQTNRVSNSVVYYKAEIGSGFAYSIDSNYDLAISDFNNDKTVVYVTGYVPAQSGIYEIKNGNIILLFRKKNNGAITIDDVKQNCIIKTYNKDEFTLLKLQKEYSFTNIPDNIFPIEWKQGTIRDSGANIGTIASDSTRICDLVNIESYTANKIWYVVDEGYRMYMGGWNGKTNPMPSGTGWLYEHGEYTIPDDAIYIRFGASSYPDISITPADGRHFHIFTNKETYELYIREKDIEKDVKRSYSYIGEKVSFEHYFNAIQYKVFKNWSNMQGGAVYGDKLVCIMAADELDSPTANGFIYDLNTGEKLHDLLFGSTLGSKTYTMPHANQVSFGTTFYNENSRFPLLYVSQVNGSTPELWASSERGVLVYDLQTEDNGETFTPVLIQAIIPDLTDTALLAKLGKYTPNYIVNPDSNQFVILGYPNASWDDMTGAQPVAILDIPSLSDGDEVVFTDSDIVDSYALPVAQGIQQSICYNGKVYTIGGYWRNPTLRVIDLTKKEVVTTVFLTAWNTNEPQFIGYWNKKILYYTAGTTGIVYELIF